MPELLEDMPLKLIATGSLGNKGASVDCYSFQDKEEGEDNVLALNDN